jgi:Zn-dependent protease
MEKLSTVQFAAIAILPLLFGITLHEVAHGWVAKFLGDKTALMMGRLTLNPLKHIDPLGTIIVPGLMMLAGGAIFGWAKPVPVTWQNLRNPKRDMALVALAGPMANLGMAFLWALIARLGILLSPVSSWASVPMILMGKVGIVLNLVLMILNLLPLPPLDGGKVLLGVLESVHVSAAKLHVPLNVAGMVLLLGLLGWVTLVDISRVISGLFA